MRSRTTVILLALATTAVVLVATPVAATDFVDQQHDAGGGSISGGNYFSSNGIAAVAQTFVPTVDNLSAVDARFWTSTCCSRNVSVRIFEGSPPSLGAEVGATTLFLAPQGAWNHAVFSPPINLIPGDTYSIVIEPIGQVLAAWTTYTANYPHGQSWRKPIGQSWQINFPQAQWDFGFRTYYTTNYPPVADADGPYAVPWGGELALDASGSYDPDDDPLTYEWSIAGGAITVGPTSDPNPAVPWQEIEALLIDCGFGCTPSFPVDLTVTDPGGLMDSAASDLIVQIPGPVAVAGGPYLVEFGIGLALFDPNDSFDPKLQPYGPTDPTVLPWLLVEWSINGTPFPFPYNVPDIAVLELGWTELVGLGIDTPGATYPVDLVIVDYFGQIATSATDLTVVDTTPPECNAGLNLIQGTELQGEFFVEFECWDLADPDPEVSADINGVPVTNGQNVDLNDSDPGITLLDLLGMIGDGIPWDQVVHEFLGGWIITAPAFGLTVHAVDDFGNETTVLVEPDFYNTTPAVGTPSAPVMPPNTPPPGAPPVTEWPPPFPPAVVTPLAAAPGDCTVELTKLWGYWNQGTFRVDATCVVPVDTMDLDLNGYAVQDGDLVELVKTWGTERSYDMFGMRRIEAAEFRLTLITTGPAGEWTATPGF
jgi:hypothetical protein